MSSLSWFTPATAPSPPDAEPRPAPAGTFFPADPVNPPLTAAAAVPPGPSSSEEDAYTFPARRYYALHPPAAQLSSQSITYALPPASEQAHEQQQQQEFLHRLAAPVYQVPVGSAEVWNSVRWLMASSWERGDGGQLSGVMRRALSEIVDEERNGEGNNGQES